MALPRQGQHGEAERAALGRHRDAPVRRQAVRDRSVERDVGIGIQEAHRVGSDHAHPVASNPLQELLLKGAPLGIGLGEAACDDDHRPDAGRRAFVDGRERSIARDCQNGQIGPLRDLKGGGIGRGGVDAYRVRVDRVDRTAEASGSQRVENAVADARSVAGGADDRDGPRSEEGKERRGCENAVPHLRAADAVLARGDGEVDLHALILDLRVERKTRPPKRFEHQLVFNAGQGPEADEAVAGRQEGQPLEKETSQALALELVIDREGDLGGDVVARDIGAGRDDPGRAADDAADDQRQLRPRIGRIALPRQQRLRRVGDREEAAPLRLRRELLEKLPQRIAV